MSRWLLIGLLLSTGGAFAFGEEFQDDFRDARSHYQHGRYAESLEIYESLAMRKADAARVAIGRSRALAAEGKLAQAFDAIETAVKAEPKNSALWAERSRLLFDRGDYSAAEESAERALQIEPESPAARLVRAEVYTETGRIKAANDEYRWFVQYYNRVQPQDAETLMLVARGAAQYARWNGASQVFQFIVNTLCADAIKADEDYWQAALFSGQLLLEKFNRAQALPEFEQALTINPRAAEALAAMGDAALQKQDLDAARQFAARALTVNPQLVAGLRLKADVFLAHGETAAALETLQEALKVNPRDQRTLARAAAVYVLEDGTPDSRRLKQLLANLDSIETLALKPDGRFETVLTELATRNPKPGYFLAQLGEMLESRRKFALAEQFLLAAVDVMPELSEPKASLGMLYMQMGRTDHARRQLDEAFRTDRFHVRVSNLRKVLDLLEDYQTITTEHFVIHFDNKADAILGPYMADYLEEIYDELVRYYGFEPPARTHFEIYHDAKGQTAHQWFSARMVGLPWIQTIGASTGMMVALASPTASKEPFNWAKVLRHEFVHVITLQQTNFNIPHWFTEALAVTAEGYARPAHWNKLLLDRVPEGNLRTLDELTAGFQRPDSADDWQFAYCQSRLYAQYMVEQFGEKSLRGMLTAYRNNHSTAEAVRMVFKIDQTEFEAGYRKFLEEIVRELKHRQPPPARPLAELERRHLDRPENASAAAEYARGLLEAGQFAQARALAEVARNVDPNEPLAAVVLAKLEVRDEKFDAALDILEAVLKRAAPNAQVLEEAARIHLLAKRFAAAAELYEIGRRHFPHEVTWVRGAAAAYLELDEPQKLKIALTQLANMDADDALVRRKLAEIALQSGDFVDAALWAHRALHVDVLDAETHRILGAAYSGDKQYGRAVRELEIALHLSPDRSDLQFLLAQALHANGHTADARHQLEQLLKRDPSHEAARNLQKVLAE